MIEVPDVISCSKCKAPSNLVYKAYTENNHPLGIVEWYHYKCSKCHWTSINGTIVKPKSMIAGEGMN